MFSELTIKAMNGYDLEDVQRCEHCTQPMWSFWIRYDERVCEDCKIVIDGFDKELTE